MNRFKYTESEFLSKLQDLTGGSVTSNVSPSELRPIPVPIPAGRHRVESVFARQGRADVRRGRTVLHFGLGGSGGTPTFLLLAYAIRKVPGGGLGHCQYEAQLSTLFLGPILFLFYLFSFGFPTGTPRKCPSWGSAARTSGSRIAARTHLIPGR